MIASMTSRTESGTALSGVSICGPEDTTLPDEFCIYNSPLVVIEEDLTPRNRAERRALEAMRKRQK